MYLTDAKSFNEGTLVIFRLWNHHHFEIFWRNLYLLTLQLTSHCLAFHERPLLLPSTCLKFGTDEQHSQRSNKKSSATYRNLSHIEDDYTILATCWNIPSLLQLNKFQQTVIAWLREQHLKLPPGNFERNQFLLVSTKPSTTCLFQKVYPVEVAICNYTKTIIIEIMDPTHNNPLP